MTIVAGPALQRTIDAIESNGVSIITEEIRNLREEVRRLQEANVYLSRQVEQNGDESEE